MNDQLAKQQLEEMLESFTAGSILHLLAELYKAYAEQAQEDGDVIAVEQCQIVEACLFAVGLGIDAACPRGPG
jgi:hypothetical protein